MTRSGSGNTSGSPRPGRRGAGRAGAHALADALEKVCQHGGVAVVEGFEEDPADELDVWLKVCFPIHPTSQKWNSPKFAAPW
jgi:hypothetical protein